MNDPLFRFLEREVTVVSKLLKEVKSNIKEVQNMASGATNATSNVLK
jgi:dynein heavy chain 1